MPNLKLANEIEDKITKKRAKRRRASIVFFIACAVLAVAIFIILNDESVNLSKDNPVSIYVMIGGVVSAIISAFSFIVMLLELLFCKVGTVSVNANYLTIYRGIIFDILYVNGEEVDRLSLIRFSNTVELVMDDGVRVTVSFRHSIFNFAYVSFSNGRPTIEL